MNRFTKYTFVWGLLVVVLLASTALANSSKEEPGRFQHVSSMKAKAFTDVDKKNDFRNYAAADAVYWYPADATGRVVGIVYDETTEDYLKNAWVENLELGFKVKTDKNGRFEINNLPDGEYTWIVKAPGFQGSTFAQFPVYTDLGATIFRFPLSSQRAIHSNIKKEKELTHQHDPEPGVYSTEPAPKANTFSTTTTDFAISSVHSDWPTIRDFTVFYDNTIYQLNMQEYMYHVVASELWAPTSSLYSNIPANELLEGFKAQAVTARTYADFNVRNYDKHTGYDLCATTHCQVYNPYYTNQMTVQAVDATEDELVLTVNNASTYDYSFVETVFSASCLGATKNNEEIWGGSPIAYLRSVPCPYDIRPTLDSGHNVGLCQDGAIGYADAGYDYKSIVTHYFSGTTVVKVNRQAREVLEVGETRISEGYITRDYAVQIRATGDYTFETSKYIDTDSTNSDTVIELYDANMTLLGSDDDGAGSRFSSLTKNLAAGTYTLRVHDWNSDNTINYAVTIKGNPSLPLVQIGDSSTTANKGNYITNVTKKIYLLNVDATKTYTLETKQLNTDCDTYLKLYNAATGALIKEDDDSGTNRYALISHYLYQSATYLLEVTTYSYAKNGAPVNFDCELRVY